MTKLLAIVLGTMILVVHVSACAESWRDLLNRADSLSKAQNQDSAVVIGKLALDRTRAEFGGNDTATARVLSQLGVYRFDAAAYDQADTLFHQALTIWEKVLGQTHAEVVAVLNDLGNLRVRQGRYPEAESLYMRVLAVREKALGPNDLGVAAIAENLGIVYSDQGRYADAEPLYQRALTIREKALDADHPDLASSLNNMGLFYTRQGRYAEAEPVYNRALAIREKIFGPDHSDVGITLSNLGILYAQQGRYAEAVPLTVRALTIREKALGPDHPEVAGSMMNLGAIYWNEGRFAEAEPLYKKALSISERALGPDHPDVSMIVANLGNLYWYEGRYAEAGPLQERALAISEKAFGPDHPDVALGLISLGVFYWDQGRYAEAEPLYKRALAIQEKTLGSNHRDLAGSLIDLGVLYMDQGRYAEAEPFYKRALAILEKALGPDHPDFAKNLLSLGVLYAIQGRHAEAEVLDKRALTIGEEALGPDHPSVAGSLSVLGKLYIAQGRYDEAASLCRQALAVKEKALGSIHPDVALGMNDLAIISSKQGHYAEAESLFTKSLSVVQAGEGWNHLHTSVIREDHSTLCRLTGDTERAYIEARTAFDIRLDNFRSNGYVLSEKDALAFSQTLRESAENYLSCYQEAGSADAGLTTSVSDVIFATKGLITDCVFERRRKLITEDDSASLALSESLRFARFRISQLYASGPGEDTTGAYKRELDSLSRTANDLEAELFRHSASFQRRQDMNNITVARIDSVLPANTSLVEYLNWDYSQLKPDSLIPRYLALIVNKGKKPEIVNLGEASEIEHLVGKYLKHMQRIASAGREPNAADMEEYRDISQKIYAKIWKPIEKHLRKGQTVFVGLDGSLNLLSLAGLLDDREKYLTESYTLHYLSSGRDLIRLKDKPASGRGLFALGDPDFDASIEARMKKTSEPLFAAATASDQEYQTRNVRSGCGSLSDLKVESLPFTGNEVQEVSHLWQGKGVDSAEVFVGAQATEDAFKTQAPGKRVIHLATHGYYLTGQCAPQMTARRSFGSDQGFVGENPLLQSGLLLAGSNLHGAGCDSAHIEDGILSASEVSGLDLTGTDLVVLSACETGLGEVKSGEGVYGLRRAFQIAGARTVISSLWPVPDQATSEVMSQLYSQSKKPLPERLRDLQLTQIKKLRASGSPDHPYSWGAFIALGDWR